MGFTFRGYDLDQLNETSQGKLFSHGRSDRHCLHHLFTVEYLVPCTCDNVGTILCCQTSNTILTNSTLSLVHFFIMSKFYVFVLCVRVRIV